MAQLGLAEPEQSTQIDVATPRAGQAESQGNTEAPDPTAVSTWTEERMLELATSLPAMRTIGHQPRGLRGSRGVILSPSRLNSLQQGGPG